MRASRWCEVDICNHQRDDGAAVQHVELRGTRTGSFAWIALSPAPDRALLTDLQGRQRRFRTAGAAKAAVDRAWP
jgi:hypothetical protein